MDIGIKVLEFKIYSLQIRIIFLLLTNGSTFAYSTKSFSGFPGTFLETVSVALANMCKHCSTLYLRLFESQFAVMRIL